MIDDSRASALIQLGAQQPKNDEFRYIVVGLTRGLRSSRPILYRYKRPDEVRDVFAVNWLTRAARELYVFEVVEQPDGDSWHLITFDIKYVYGKRTAQRRKPTKEYSEIKEAMYSQCCGRIDSSTYICPHDASHVPRIIVDTDPEAMKVKSWPVKPLEEKTLEYVRNAVLEAINYFKGAALRILSESEKRLRGQGVRRARELLSTLQLMLNAPWRPKVERLVGPEPFAELDAVTKMLEDALQKRRGSNSKR